MISTADLEVKGKASASVLASRECIQHIFQITLTFDQVDQARIEQGDRFSGVNSDQSLYGAVWRNG